MDTVFVFGYPRSIGGANVELWSTLRLWRRYGLSVTCVPTREYEPDWRDRLDGIGVRTLEIEPDQLADATELQGAVVFGSCNHYLIEYAPILRRLGCKLVWQNCMGWILPQARLDHHANGCFDRYVFHCRYQADQLTPQLKKWGYTDRQGFVIPGAFEPSDFAFNPLPHLQDEMFMVGRISRAAEDKFTTELWRQYMQVPHVVGAEILGWRRELQWRCGPMPAWAHGYEPGSMTPQALLASLHCYCPGYGAPSAENWPRVGLEAMAAGVPLVVENRGGWPEMVDNGRTGYVCRNHWEMSYRIGHLAYNEDMRLAMAQEARADVEQRLACPDRIWAGWKRVFDSLEP